MVTGNGSLIPICFLSNRSLLPSLTVVWKWQGAGKFYILYIFSWIALDIVWLVTSCKLLCCIKKVEQTFFWIKASRVKIVFLISIAASYLFPRSKSFDRQVTKQIAVLKTSSFSYKKYSFNHIHSKFYLLTTYYMVCKK